MLSKNNEKMLTERNMNQRQRFGLRKLTVGVASVLLGTTFFMGTQVAQADSLGNAPAEKQPVAQQVTSTTNNDPAVKGNAVKLPSQSATDPTEGGTTASHSTTPVSGDRSATQTVNTNAVKANATSDASKSATNGQKDSATVNPGSASKKQDKNANLLSTSLQETTAGTTITDNGQTKVNLTRDNYQNNRQLIFNAYGKAGDTITVNVPKIFTPSADQDKAHGVTVKENQNSDGSTTFTYSFTNSANRSFGLNMVLQTAIQDWDLLNAGDQYQITVKKNGNSEAQITYIIGKTDTSTGQVTKKDTEITDAIVKVDPTEHGNLVQGQKYAFGIQLPNTGSADSDNYKGSLTIVVPDGFVLDQGGAYGITADSDFGKIDAVNPQGLQISQNGGAGTPITVNFDNSKSNLNNDHILFWGTYTKNLNAENNKFVVNPFDYQTENKGQLSAIKHFTGKAQAINLPVTDTERSSVKSVFTVPSKIGTDNGTANGAHQYEDTNNWKYPDGSTSISITNDGNVAQTNVKVHLDVEPGTIFTSKGINFNMTGENAGIRVIATLKDGSKIVLVDHNMQPVNSNSDSASLDKDTSAKDGSNIKALDITLDKIHAGSEADITFNSGTSAILTSATSKKAGDQADYSYTVSSDQQAVSKPEAKQVEIVDPDKVTFQLNFKGISQNFQNGTYDKNSINSAGLMNSGKISYIIYHNKEDKNRPSSYFIVIPAGFHVEDAANNLRLFHNGQVLPSDQGTIKLLPDRGPEGEYIYRVNLSFTPGQNGEGNPVYVQKDNNLDIPLTINDNQGPASFNYIQHQAGNSEHGQTGIALLMEINSDGDVKDSDGFQGNDFHSFTLGGKTYSVMPEDLGYHTTSIPWGYSDAKYTFLGPSTYGADSGVRNSASSKYQDPENPGVTELQFGSKVPNAAMQSGQLRLSNLLTEAGDSKYSYNIINIPNGDDVDFKLSSGIVTSSDGNNNSTLWYSTNTFTDTARLNHALTDAEMQSLGFVKADAVHDWSNIKSVLLMTGPLTKETTVNAYVPFTVNGMRNGLKTANVTLQNLFQGEHNNTVVSDNPTLNLHVTRYVTVTTKWINQDTGTDIKPAETGDPLTAGSSYSTLPLDTSEIPEGYYLSGTPSNANGTVDTSDVIVKYVYVKKEGPSAKITFVDDDANADHPTMISLPSPITDYGESNAQINFDDLSNDITSLTNHGFIIKSVHNDTNNKDLTLPTTPDWSTLFGKFDNAANTTKSFTIHLGHKTNQTNDTKAFNEIVHYKYNDAQGNHTNQQAHKDESTTVTFTRTITKDFATGQTSYGDWDKTSKNFDDIKSPTIPGYTPDKGEVTGSSVAITGDPKTPIEATVYYTPDAQQATLNFVDDDDLSSTKMPASIPAQGNTGSEITFEDKDGKSVADIIKGLEEKHYAFVKADGLTVTDPTSTNWNTIFGTYDTDDKTPQTFTLHFKHGTQKVSGTAMAKETINYVYSNGAKAHDSYTHEVTYSHSGTKDLVTNVTKWNDSTKDNPGGWQITNDSTAFVDVTSPKIAGYTPDYAQVEAPAVKLNQLKDNAEQDYTQKVTYKIDQQKATLSFVDEDATGTESKYPESPISVTGDSAKTISFKDTNGQAVDKIISNLDQQGYKIDKVVNDQNPEQNLGQNWNKVFGNFDQDKTKDQSFTIYLKHKTQPVSESAQVTETINYLYKGTNMQAANPYNKTVTYTRTGTKDLVSNQTQWDQDGWTTKDGLVPVNSPVITGYTADKTTVAAPEVDLTKLTNGGKVTLPQIIVYYIKNATKQFAILNFIDDDEQETPINDYDSVMVKGLSGKPIEFKDVANSIKQLEDKHYLLASLTRGTENVNKTALLMLLMATNNNSVKISDNTNWSTIFGNFDDDDSTNQVFTLHFKHAHGPVENRTVTETIHYVYRDGKMAHPDQQTSLTFVANDGSYHDLVDSKLDHITGWQIDGQTADTGSFARVPNPAVNGFHVVSAVTSDAKNALDGNRVKAFTGIKSDSKNIEVTVTYAKNEPVAPTTESVTDQKTVTETIHYVYSDGTKAHADYVADRIFTRTGTKDLTTGEVSWNAWTPANAEFKAVQSPVIAGATPDQLSVAEQTVDANSADVVVTVVYTKNQQPSIPTQPTVPAQPTTPEKPVVPAKPAPSTEPTQPGLAPEPATPSQVVQPADSVQVAQGQVRQPVEKANPVPNKSTAKTLPQTGNEQRTGLIGLGLASLLGALGLGALLKRHGNG